MRRWKGPQSQQHQRLLCIYAVTRKPISSPLSIRSYATEPSRVRRRNPTGAHSDQKGSWSLKRQRGGRDLYPVRTNTKLGPGHKFAFKHEYILPIDGLSDTTLLARALKSLENVYDRLMHPASKSGPSEMDALDPDHQKWEAFKASISTLFETPWSKLSSKEKKQHKELTSILATSIESASNHLYFAYLDQALTANGLGIVQSMDGIDLRWPTEWYPKARALPREVHLHIGPTNSGKTYTALKRLENSKGGFYAGPLRLLAHEVYSRFNANGILCDLITGDDIRTEVPENKPGRIYASTVEMVEVGKDVDVAVIDEIQMIADENRGWAWTRAFVGAPATEVHLCGEARVLPLIKEMAASMGDNLHVHEYQRLNPLKVETKSLQGDFKKLQKGDCVVTFSIVNIHALRKQIEQQSGRRVAIVYGSLPPETRAQQAALFNDPDNDYDFLVASDAVGMGLNLSIKRIIFDSVHKFNGTTRIQLSIPQIKQIAGRAGRYRTSHDDTSKTTTSQTSATKGTNPGYVTSVNDVDLPVIKNALSKEAPPIRQAGLLPMGDFIIDYAARLPAGIPHEYILQRVCDAASILPRFSICSTREQISISRVIQGVPGLSTHDLCILTAAPADYRSPLGKKVIRALAAAVGVGKQTTVMDVNEIPLEVLALPMSPSPLYLEKLEGLHKSLTVFVWLAYRFTSVFMESDVAFHAKSMVEEKINTYLTNYSASRQLQKRLRKLEGATRKVDGTFDPYKTLDPPVANDDFSEHASEDLAEEQPGYLEDASALPIDWSQNGGDETNSDVIKQDEVQSEERAARVNE